MLYFLKFSAYLLVLLLAGLWLKPQAAFNGAPIKTVPWSIQASDADFSMQKYSNGHYTFTAHSHLENVSPRMLHWFYKNQAKKHLNFNNQTLPWFKLSQPETIVNLAIVSSPEQSSNELMHGTVFDEHSKINDHQWRMRYRIGSFGEEGITLKVLHAGYVVGQIDYVFSNNKNGTAVHISGTLGVDLPIIGDIANFYLFHKVYPSHLMEDWLGYTVESYQHMEKLIPILYSQQHAGSYSISS